MKFVAFNGSPSGKASATGRIIEAFLAGARRAGAEADCYHLCEYNIEQCRGCFSCWFRSPGQCVLWDDMPELLNAYQTADVVCFGSPVYSWNMTALLKNFVDRLVPLKSPLLTHQNGHFDMADTQKREQRYVAISNCGFPGENNFEIIKAALSICNPALEIYRNCGKLLVSKQPDVQDTVHQYLTAVEQAGYEFSATGTVSAETLALLDRSLMSTADYVKFLGMQ